MKALSTSAELAGVHLRLTGGSETYVRGDAERLTEAAFLVAEHALNRCTAGEKVEIDVSVRDGARVLCGVELISPKQACTRSRRSSAGQVSRGSRESIQRSM